MRDTLPDWKATPRPERVEMVRKMIEADLSFSQIAKKFTGVSRNGVIGLVHRIEAAEGKPMKRNRQVGGRPAPKASAPEVTRPAPKQPKPAANTVRPPVLPKVDPPVEVQISTPVEVELPPITLSIERAVGFIPLNGVSPIPILDLPLRARCRWPVDVPGQELHFACGAATVNAEHVYCAPHRRLASRGATPQGAF